MKQLDLLLSSENKLNKALQSHLQMLTDEKKLHGARYRVALCCNIVADGVVGTVNSLVDIQSITKMFTAVTILQLQEKGMLSLQDSVAKFLPEFQKVPFSEITILHLLTHTSGLAALQDAFPERDMDWETDVERTKVKETWIPAILNKGLFFEPGTKWEYSKAGFCILGEIIQRLTGQKAEEYIRNNILLPCEMTKSHWNPDMDPIWDEIPKTAWGLLVPLDELVRFGAMLAESGVYNGKRVLSEKSVEAMETNYLPPDRKDYCWDHGGRPVAYGAGCPVYVPGYETQWTVGARTIYHEGAGASMLLVNRKERLAAAWSTPFADQIGWCEEAVKGTADVLWKYICGI